MLKKLSPLILTVLLAFVAVAPLLHSGLIPTHDGEYHIIRFYEFDKTLISGVFYPRWAEGLNNGYGVPLFNFVYPLPNYVSSFLHFLGLSFIDSFKFSMFFSSILGAVFFYLWSRIFWGEMGAVVGSVFYTFSPYHLVDVYIRGSVGEVWALSLFPAFLWVITRFVLKNKTIYFVASSLFLALIIFSHNILALMFLPFAFAYAGFLFWINKGDRRDSGRLVVGLILVFILGMGLSSVFWIPAIFEKQFTVGLEVFGFESNFPDLFELILPSWGSGFWGSGFGTAMSVQIGVANLVAVFLAVAALLFFKKKSKEKKIIVFFLFVFFLILFFMLKTSLPVWKAVPFMSYFQFPWRFLSLEILSTSFLSGSIVWLLKNSRYIKTIWFLLIALGVLLSLGYAKPAHYLDRDDNYYLTKSNFIDGTNSPGNAFNTVYFKNNLPKTKEKLTIVDRKGIIKSVDIKPELYQFETKNDKESRAVVNTYYFPGWEVFVNSKKIAHKIEENGLFSFLLPAGENEVAIKFSNTIPRSIGLLGFLISGSILFVLLIKVLSATIRNNEYSN